MVPLLPCCFGRSCVVEWLLVVEGVGPDVDGLGRFLVHQFPDLGKGPEVLLWLLVDLVRVAKAEVSAVPLRPPLMLCSLHNNNISDHNIDRSACQRFNGSSRVRPSKPATHHAGTSSASRQLPHQNNRLPCPHETRTPSSHPCLPFLTLNQPNQLLAILSKPTRSCYNPK